MDLTSTPGRDASHSFERVSETSGSAVYKFPQYASHQKGTLPLRLVVKAFAPTVMAGRSIPADQLYLSLGKLRHTQHVLLMYNRAAAFIAANSQTDQTLPDDLRLSRFHASELFSVLGFQTEAPGDQVRVLDLDELIEDVEGWYESEILAHREQIKSGFVSFEGLGELFTPGTVVTGPTSLGSGTVQTAYVVTCGFFEEKKTLFGMEKCFRLELEYIIAFGAYFSTVRFEEVFSGWIGSKVKAVKEIPYHPASAEDMQKFTNRGEQCVRYLKQDLNRKEAVAPFMEYSAGAFYPHRSDKNSQSASVSHGGGRVVLDIARGITLGHYPSRGSDEATLAMMQAVNRYKRALLAAPPPNVRHVNEDGTTLVPPHADGQLLMHAPPPSLHHLVWPAVVGFSLATKSWGHILVDNLRQIAFNDAAFDQLVLAPERKRLIRALVSFGGHSKFQDIIAGKTGGAVFLLHGPPGVGKTLTAEAIAEVLHRPLYYVTMGELGTSPEAMEQRLADVLDLCAGWNALALIDEADVFLEKRGGGNGSDVVRNAMVCVMLRLIEYHEGILFLTTNRVVNFDPAVESRVTVALKYNHLKPEAREQVWRNLIGRLNGICVDMADRDFVQLSSHVMNGRQIKNAVRLAVALAEEEKEALTMGHFEQTISITALGRQEMAEAEDY
ncbi:hypothetical protein HDU84_004520 [Entophlyctis sp. JEL0112]|nr:hypothetical protein HDU84_004520 [Entophlyctis sp. JEL0112]